jgi:hypothetical protein
MLLVAWLVAACLSWCTLRHGLELSPDAWQYWSASISLLEGRGYVDGHGLSVQGWPPGYSIWLAGWQACCGRSVQTIVLAECFAIGWMAAAIAAWAQLRRQDTQLRRQDTQRRWPVLVAAVAASLAAARGAGSERLMLGFLFTALYCIERLRPARGASCAWLLLLLTGCCAAMVLVRHAALAFLPGMWCLLFGIAAGDTKRATRMWLVVLIGTATAWWGSRLLLQQDSEAWFGGVHSVPSLLAAAAAGINRGLWPWPVGIVLFVATWLGFGPLRQRVAPFLGLPSERLRHGDVGMFVLLSLSALFAIYLLVYVADLPSARFVRFASITTAVLLAAVVADCTKPRLRWLLLVLLLLPNVVYAAKHAIVGRSGTTNINADGGSSFVPHDAVIGAPGSVEQVLPNGLRNVPEPLFRWQRQRLERGEGR